VKKDFFQILQIFFGLLTLGCGVESLAGFEQQGALSLSTKKYNLAPSTKYSNSQTGFELSEKVVWELSKKWQFNADGKVIYDSQEKMAENRSSLVGRSLSLDWSHKSWLIRTGTQIQTQSFTDGLNPFDVIHAKYSRDPTSTQSFGSDGVSLQFDNGSLIGTLFYVPLQRVNLLPSPSSLWWPREKNLPIDSEFVNEAKIPSDVEYVISGGEEIDRARRNSYMFRAQWLNSDFEMAVQYYEGLAHDPKLFFSATSTNFVLDSPVELIPFYYRHRVVSAGLVLPIKDWTFKWAANQSQPLGNDSRLPEAESQTVFAIEKNQEFKFGLVTWILENSRQYRKAQNQISFLRSIYENAWILGLRIPLYDRHQFFIGGIYDSVGPSSIYRINYKIKITDQMSLELESQQLDGSEGTMLNLYKNHDHHMLKLNWLW
jgi:hypothetical protein